MISNFPYYRWEKIDWKGYDKFLPEDSLKQKYGGEVVRNGYRLVLIQPQNNVELPPLNTMIKEGNYYKIYYHMDKDWNNIEYFPNYGRSIMCLNIYFLKNNIFRIFFSSIDDDFWDDIYSVGSVNDVLKKLEEIKELLPLMRYNDFRVFFQPDNCFITFCGIEKHSNIYSSFKYKINEDNKFVGYLHLDKMVNDGKLILKNLDDYYITES